jgi:hypothetical protein
MEPDRYRRARRFAAKRFGVEEVVVVHVTTKVLAVLSVATAAVGSAGYASGLMGSGSDHSSRQPPDQEVWLVDQSNSPGRAFGGTLYIYSGRDLQADAAAPPLERVDLGAGTADLCVAETGAPPVRPHMLAFSPQQSHAVLTFVVSGHVVFFDAESRQPLRCVQTEPGAGGARQAHAAYPTPDGRYVLVANQNGKKLERIATDYRRNTFTQQPDATLDLASGTTPNGAPRQDPLLRPDNAPICPFVPASGFPAYVSLRGGGLFAVDPYVTPMAIVAEYTAATVPRNGCGFIEARGSVYANAGGATATHLDGWFLYRLPVGGRRTYKATNPPDVPAVEPIAADDSPHRDAHGIAISRHGDYVWFFDRAGNKVEIYKARTGRAMGTLTLESAHSADPTPDLAVTSSDGRYMYVSLRGPNPLSGDPHASTGSTPGLLVIQLGADGRTGTVRGLAPITNLDAGGVERADAHGIAIRRVGRTN